MVIDTSAIMAMVQGELERRAFLEARANVELVSVTPEQAHPARAAFSRFGKGRHRVSLNFGDCFSYSLAVATADAAIVSIAR